MKKNITEIKRNLVERLFTVLHRDYNECTLYTPGIENIVPGANGITIKRLENYDYKTNKTTLRYKLHVVTINDANHYDWETTVAKFDSLDPDTREQIERFINAKCDNAPAADMPTTFVGHAYYFTLQGRKKTNKIQSNMKQIVTDNAELLEILVANGINIICSDDMKMMVTDTDAARIDAIVAEKAPAAFADYIIC